MPFGQLPILDDAEARDPPLIGLAIDADSRDESDRRSRIPRLPVVSERNCREAWPLMEMCISVEPTRRLRGNPQQPHDEGDRDANGMEGDCVVAILGDFPKDPRGRNSNAAGVGA